MSDEKICPFMSRPDGTTDTYGNTRFAPVYCQKDRCAAWAKINRRFDGDGNIAEASFGCRLIP